MVVDFSATRTPGRVTPILAQGLGAIGSSALGFGMLAIDAPRAWALVSAVPMLGALVWIAKHGSGRATRVLASERELRILGAREHIQAVETVTLLRWVEPHTGRRLGDAFEFASRGERLRFGVRTTLATVDDERAIGVDFEVPETAAAPFIRLYARGGRVPSRSALFRVTPLASTARVFLGIVPFVVGSLAVALSVMTVDSIWPGRIPALARASVAGVLVVAILIATFRRLSREQAEWSLSFEDSEILLRDETGECRRRFPIEEFSWERGSYAYHTKYGSHRVSVATIHGVVGEIRVGVWEDASGSEPPSKARRPEYLVERSEFDRLVVHLRERLPSRT